MYPIFDAGFLTNEFPLPRAWGKVVGISRWVVCLASSMHSSVRITTLLVTSRNSSTSRIHWMTPIRTGSFRRNASSSCIFLTSSVEKESYGTSFSEVIAQIWIIPCNGFESMTADPWKRVKKSSIREGSKSIMICTLNISSRWIGLLSKSSSSTRRISIYRRRVRFAIRIRLTLERLMSFESSLERRHEDLWRGLAWDNQIFNIRGGCSHLSHQSAFWH